MSHLDPDAVRALVRERLRDYLAAPTAAPATPPASPKRPLIDEPTILALPEGSRYPVPSGALVTPLARDAARARRITLEEATSPTVGARPSGQGARQVAIAADHGGVALKRALVAHLQAEGFAVLDLGPADESSVDYPDYAYAVAKLVSDGAVEAGIMVDGVGIGSCMAANKVPGVRASLCYDVSTARNAREHNHANYLTLGGQLHGPLLAKQIVSAWLATPFGGGRHARRVEKIMDIEARYLKR